MTLKHMIFGERSLTKVAAIFENRDSAEHAAQQLKQTGMMTEAQVMLVGPGDLAGPSDAPLSRKLEPEQSGIWHTLIRAHAIAGALGALTAALVYSGLFIFGNEAILSTPYLSFWALLFIGASVGLLIGGLLTLRPDQYRVIAAVRRAVAQGRWAVVSHPMNHQQTEFAMSELRNCSTRVVRSL
ncbi:MAG: hypothetical protein GZ085_04090 [Sulfuriferula multivorans]|uniref:Uncharacterized protein n=1 Tax=Sulfuriferula multivorans TaxID=1559896 RepID=A0A7C9P8D4_9PROT|nr:hypothetical protein [Sulfuriferula multivorans]